MLDQNLIIGLVVLAIIVFGIYMYAPSLRSMMSGLGLEGFANKKTAGMPGKPSGQNIKTPGATPTMGGSGNKGNSMGSLKGVNKHMAPKPHGNGKEGFADYANMNDSMSGVPMEAAAKPQGCYPRKQLNPMELLPNDPNSQWAAVNPVGSGDIQGKNFLSAGALIGINTVGQSLRNGNFQLRAEPPNPQVQVGPWMQSTIEPDLQRRPLE